MTYSNQPVLYSYRIVLKAGSNPALAMKIILVSSTGTMNRFVRMYCQPNDKF